MLGRPPAKLLTISKFRYLLGQKLSSILSRWRNHSNLLFCKHSLMVCNCNIFLSFTTEIFFSGVILHIHLIMFASFFSNAITSSFLTGQVWLICSTILYTLTEYNLPFTPEAKPLLVHPFQPSVAFHIENSHLFCSAKQMTSF